MKLRNKKTGEIGEIGYIGSTDGSIAVNPINRVACETIASYNSLAELNKEWEDYVEPKEYWRITDLGELKSIRLDQHHQNIGKCKRIGNYFETEKEAEKAVEKLEAWKRLKDKGFRFIGVEDAERTIRFEIPFRAGYDSCDAEADLDLLFSGGGE